MKLSAWSSDRWIALAAVVVAICALGVSLYASWLDRDTTLRSTKPNMRVSYFYDETGSGFRFGNQGVGPAYLYWFQIRVDGKPVQNWHEMTARIYTGPKETLDFLRIDFLRPTHVWGRGSDVKIFWAPSGPLDTHLRKDNTRIDFRACYCSIFDDCWLLSRRNAPSPIDSCAPTPKIRYGGAFEPAGEW